MKRLILCLLIACISLLLVFAYSDSSSSRGKCCSTCSAEAKAKVAEHVLLSKASFEELLSGKTLNADFSSTKSIIVFMDKETVRDYNQVENFSKWITKKNLDIKVYTVLNGKNKEELKDIARSNNILSALWAPSIVNEMKVEKYPVAYYVVNGSIVDKTENLSVGHLTQMVWCEGCAKVKTDKCCEYTSNNAEAIKKEGKNVTKEKKNIKNKEKKDIKNNDKSKCNKEGCCGGNCNCGPNCKC